MTAFKRCQAKYVKGKYKTTNWPEYEAGLRQRGSLTVWISEDELSGWGPPKHGRRKPGGQVQYSNHASRMPTLVKQIERPLGSVSADGAYDSEAVYKAIENHTKDRSPRVLIPPKKNAHVRAATPTTRERNRNVRSRARHGKRQWHRRSGYSRRSMVENTMPESHRVE